MSYQYYIVDAFSDVAFGGVPVAVFPEATKIPPAYFHVLSEEINTTDSVFIEHTDEKNRFIFHFFNRNGRCQPGAHSIIAGLAALRQHNDIQDDHTTTAIKIDTLEDSIDAFVDPDASEFPFLLKQTVSPTIDYFTPNLNETAEIIGLNAEDISIKHYSSLIASSGGPFLIVPLKSYIAVREAKFNLDAWSASSLPTSLVDKILLFAPNTDKDGADFHTRVLDKSRLGELDPPVGEVLPAFSAYLCEQKHVQRGTHSITIKRGPNDGRQSLLHLEIDNRGELPLTLRIGGSAVLTAQGEIWENNSIIR